MGKGTIKSGGTNGLYAIDVVRDVANVLASKATLEQRSLDIAEEIITAAADRDAAKSDLDSAVNTANNLIDDYGQLESPSEVALEVIQTAIKAVADFSIVYGEKDRKYRALVLDKASVDSEISNLESVDETIEVAAWCSDFSENLTGDVGTVEIPGERTILLIRPGDSDGAVYSAPRDGILHPSQNGSSASVWYNWTMFPGWQKWIPQYRRGEITAIDDVANTCTVTITDDKSTVENLSVNYITSSEDVPIEYMTCNHEAFAVGDDVLIEFQNVTTSGTVDNWANPKVIGFISNPKDCPVVFGYRVQPNPGCETADNEECWNGWGAPFDDGGDPPVLINPPWGTIESGSQTQSLLVYENGWQHWRDPETQTWSATSGTIDWQGNGMLCGWFGGNQGSRYRIHDQASWVAYEGIAISTWSPVTGACVREFAGKKIIITVSDEGNGSKLETYDADTGNIEWQSSVSHGTYDLSGWQNTGSFWLFNAAGTEAVQIREYSGDDPYHGPCHITSPVWRRKMKLAVSLRIGGGGTIVADGVITDLGDEMPVIDQQYDYTFYPAPVAKVGSMLACVGVFQSATVPYDIVGLTQREYEEEDNTYSFSYKFYDYKGNIETSAELWNTRTWSATRWEDPTPITLGVGMICNDDGQAQRRGGTYDGGDTCVYELFPIGCSGEATIRCGVRFTGGGGTDVEHEVLDSFNGTGTGGSQISDPHRGTENRPAFGNTWTATTTSFFTTISLAVPYMDMRFGQLITVVEKIIRDYSDGKVLGNPCNQPQTEDYTQVGNITVNLTITVFANGNAIDIEEREDVTAIDNPDTFFYYPNSKLAQSVFRKCRGWHGRAVVSDYLFQSPQKDPRPMASAGGSSYCISYVDRWVKDDEEDPQNEHVPPIRSVLSSYPIALNIPGTFPNAAPVTPVEPKAGS